MSMMSRIATLQDEARETGDAEMVELCERAGGGDLWAFGEIAPMIADSNITLTMSAGNVATTIKVFGDVAKSDIADIEVRDACWDAAQNIANELKGK